jgi:transcriptional regulator with XRE-family HTH domain
MTQYDLAKAADVHPNQVYSIESGRRQSLRRDTLKRYAHALRVSESYLLTGLSGVLTPEGDVLPDLADYLSRTAGLDAEQIELVRRIIEAFEAEHELADLRTARSESRMAAENAVEYESEAPSALGPGREPIPFDEQIERLPGEPIAAESGEDLRRAFDEEEKG